MNDSIRQFSRSVRIRVHHAYGLLTQSYRKIPDFLIIGVQKGGTSSLFSYLKYHPQIKLPIKKEIHYFNIYYDKGIKWYRAYFPPQSSDYLSGEASPDYIFHPQAPTRVKDLNPSMKLIVLVRDPIARAYSAYQMNKRMGIDKRATFEDAVKYELDHTEAYKDVYNYQRHNFFYLERGLYYKQLSHWEEQFDKSQMLVIKSEDFFIETTAVLENIQKFLGINTLMPPTLKPMNVGDYPSLSDDTYTSLQTYYKEDSEKLKTEWQIEFD